MRALSLSLSVAAVLGLAPACAHAQEAPQATEKSDAVAASDDPDAASTDDGDALAIAAIVIFAFGVKLRRTQVAGKMSEAGVSVPRE